MTEDQPAGDAATGAGGDALGALRFGWDDAYDIGRDDQRGYWARRRDGLADDPDALWSAIRADYAVKRVPCGLPAGKAG